MSTEKLSALDADSWNKLSPEQKRTRFEQLDKAGEIPVFIEQTLEIRSPSFNPNRLTGRQAVLIGFAFAVLLALVIFGTDVFRVESDDPRPSAYAPRAAAGLVPLRGHIMPGVRIYDGAGHFVGIIASVQPEKPNRSFVVQFANGELSRKDWDAALSFNWHVGE